MAKKVKIGIDLGATRTKIGLVDSKGSIFFKRELTTPSASGEKEVIDSLISNIAAIIIEKRLDKKDIAGVGLGVPGPVDYRKGVVPYFPNLKGWDNVPLADTLKRRLKIAVRLDNDVNAITLAEHRFGAGRGVKNMVCITLGTGVGGGLVLNGEIYRGSTMLAGEIGHIPINETGPGCNCGGVACLERYIGNRYILRRARRVFGKGITLERLSRIARHGNGKARAIWQDVALKLSVALTAVVNLLNPELIVIGGGVSNAGSLILTPLKRELKRRPMRDQAAHVKVVRALLGNDAGIIGASLLLEETA